MASLHGLQYYALALLGTASAIRWQRCGQSARRHHDSPGVANSSLGLSPAAKPLLGKCKLLRIQRQCSDPTAAIRHIALPALADHAALAERAQATSSVITLKPASTLGPNEVEIATSVASRPRAIRMRPMRGMLCRASNVYQRPPR